MSLTTNVYLRGRILPAFIVGNNFFTTEELDTIRDYCDNNLLDNNLGSTVVNETVNIITKPTLQYTDKTRKSKIKFHTLNDNTSWFFQKTFKIVESINNEYFGFDLVGYDHFQYTNYSVNEYYNWHTDAPLGTPLPTEVNYARKLSLSIVLSDSSEYTGGEFEILDDPLDPKKIPQEKGTVIFFPSFMFHRVLPVLSGIRKSIVIWALGPPFK